MIPFLKSLKRRVLLTFAVKSENKNLFTTLPGRGSRGGVPEKIFFIETLFSFSLLNFTLMNSKAKTTYVYALTLKLNAIITQSQNN